MGEIDTDSMRRWREQWTCAYSTQKQRLAMLNTFFSFAERESWVSKSPVTGIRPPKSDSSPTMPLVESRINSWNRRVFGPDYLVTDWVGKRNSPGEVFASALGHTSWKP